MPLETEKELATMGGKTNKKRSLQVLAQPKHVSAKGSYYTASWSGAGSLMPIGFEPVWSWCSVLLSRHLQTAGPEPSPSCGAEPSVPLGSGPGLWHPRLLLH